MKIKFLQNIIDKIRNKPNFTKLLVYKVKGYGKLREIETLILGSSHLANGYIPIEGEYNFAMPSQDLYYAYNLYKKFNNYDVENLVIAMSVFTPGLSIIKTQCAEFSVPYKVLLGIDYQEEEFAQKKDLYSLEQKCQEEIEKYKKEIRIPYEYYGGLLKFPHKKFDVEKAHERALGHLKNNQRPISQMHYCNKILDMAKQYNQRVFFVIPPVTKAYREVLPNKEFLFKDLYEIVKNYDNAIVLDYYDTGLFNEKKDFTNEDHLNQRGAEKLAKLVREKIEEYWEYEGHEE